MIKVTVRSPQFDKETKQWGDVKTIKEHENGKYAGVYNGVLTIYSEDPEGNTTAQAKGVAGYMPDRWLDWVKE